MSDMNKFEQFLGDLKHELVENDILIEKFKELFKEELTKPCKHGFVRTKISACGDCILEKEDMKLCRCGHNRNKHFASSEECVASLSLTKKTQCYCKKFHLLEKGEDNGN